MEFKDAIGLSLQEADAVRFYWNLWIVAAVGSLGFLAGIKARETARRLRPIVLLSFLAFAFGNLAALDGAQRPRVGLQTIAIARASTAEERALTAMLVIPTRAQYWSYHLAGDALACVGILGLAGAGRTTRG